MNVRVLWISKLTLSYIKVSSTHDPVTISDRPSASIHTENTMHTRLVDCGSRRLLQSNMRTRLAEAAVGGDYGDSAQDTIMLSPAVQYELSPVPDIQFFIFFQCFS